MLIIEIKAYLSDRNQGVYLEVIDEHKVNQKERTLPFAGIRVPVKSFPLMAPRRVLLKVYNQRRVKRMVRKEAYPTVIGDENIRAIFWLAIV